MKWDSSFELGIEAIDGQHKKIFEHLLAIEKSVAKREPWHITSFFLSQLAEYMRFHLAVEEALMEIIRYPDRDDHGASHARLLQEIARLEAQLKQDASGESLVGFFENWFLGHVLSSDREYLAYIREELPALLVRRGT